eukprot:9468140-Pyramimonas_sp.AAC.1
MTRSPPASSDPPEVAAVAWATLDNSVVLLARKAATILNGLHDVTGVLKVNAKAGELLSVFGSQDVANVVMALRGYYMAGLLADASETVADNAELSGSTSPELTAVCAAVKHVSE